MAMNAELQQENLRVITELNELKATLDGLEKERDFYFGKLRDIEVMCQETEAEQLPIIKRILDILYATAVSLTLFCQSLSKIFSVFNQLSYIKKSFGLLTKQLIIYTFQSLK